MNEIGVPYIEEDKRGNKWEFIDLGVPKCCRLGVSKEEADEIDRKTQEEYDKKFK